MKSVKQKIEEQTAELKDIKAKRAQNGAQQNSIYARLEEMYDESEWEFDEYSSLQTAKEYTIKQGAQLHKQEDKLIKKLTKLIKRRKIEPDDELKQLLNLN